MIKRLFHTTSLKANIIANFIGNGWTAVMGLIFVPYYINYIGAEGYGLIGIFASMQVVLSLLDGGMSTTLNREVARLSAIPGTATQIGNLVKSLGTVYWGVALLAGSIAAALSPLLAKYWIHSSTLDSNIITYSLILLSISLVFQFPSGFYSGGMMGLQRQVSLNLLKVIFATVRSVGALLILVYISPSILAFFSWTAIVSLLQAFAFRAALWYFLPKTPAKPVFDKDELKKVWKFAASLTGIGLTSVLLTQIDSVILSKILPLEKFGYYSLAFTLGAISYNLAGPVSQSYFPKFSSLVATGEHHQLTKLYHQGCQFVTLLVVPFAMFFAIFSREILFIWTNNTVTTDNTWQMASVISIAVALHCLMFIPYMLSLAHSYTRLALLTNIAILVVLIPGTIFSAIRYGGLGGAVCLLIINVIYLFVTPLLLHKRLLKGEAFKWYWNDTLLPAFLTLSVLLAVRFGFNFSKFSYVQTIAALAVTGMVSFAVSLVSLSGIRNGVWQNVKLLKEKIKK